MRTREELAETIAVTLRGEDQFGYTDISDLSDAVLDSRYDLLAVADAVLADYQPKPRTVDNIPSCVNYQSEQSIWYSLRYDGQAMYSVMEKLLDGTSLAQCRPTKMTTPTKPAASRDGLVHPGGNIEELRELPVEELVIWYSLRRYDDDNAKATLDLGWKRDSHGTWLSAIVDPEDDYAYKPLLPATVLFTPEATA